MVVIGAGVGGLSAAALLLKAGYPVTVLEAHIYPGGSAGTFYHQGYRFDAGATLAGGFAPGGPHARLADLLGLEWPVQPVDPAWVVHLGGRKVTQWSNRAQWQDEFQSHFPESAPFLGKQERLAGLAWDVSSRPFPWPPSSPSDLLLLLAALRPATLLAAPYALQTVASLLPPDASPLLRTFVDAQLLISAQTGAQQANALYGSAAFDLPRRGVNHVHGGIGSLAATLADWIKANGGQVIYRQQVEQIVARAGRAVAVRTRKGLELPCDILLANLTPWGLAGLLNGTTPARLKREVAKRPPTWGAFTLYLGLESSALGQPASDHFQVVADPDQPLGEGNSVFISLSPQDDPCRAPFGMRAATLSTHTVVKDWELSEDAYQARRAAMADTLLSAAEIALPGLRSATRLQLDGTPRAFAFFTRRPGGMVGGFPQTSLLRVRGPWSGLPNLWLVGDSIFPGQSTAGVTLGALRVAAEVMRRA